MRTVTVWAVVRTVTVWAVVLFTVQHWAAGNFIQEVSGTVGGSLKVLCPYPRSLLLFRKYWCKGPSQGFCFALVWSTVGSEAEETAGRVSIKDDHRTHSFTVTMREVTQEDSGVYWCGAYEGGVDKLDEVTVAVSSDDIRYRKPVGSADMKIGQPPSPLAVTLPADTVPTPPTRTGPPAGAPETPTHSPASYMALQWKVKVALIWVLPCATLILWIMGRNQRNPLQEDGVERREGAVASTRPHCHVGVPTAQRPASSVDVTK